MADCRLCRWYQPRYGKVVAPIWARAWCGYRGAWMSVVGLAAATEYGCVSYQKRKSDSAGGFETGSEEDEHAQD